MFDEETVEDDDDIFGVTDDETEDDETAAPAEPEPVAEAAKPKPKKVAPAPVATDSELAQIGLNALKQSWVNDAKAAGHAAADFNSLGIAGLDDAAKTQFLAEAAKSHAARVEELKALGFTYNPDAPAEAAEEASDAIAAKEWGGFGPGTSATGDETLSEQIMEEVKRGDTRAVIGNLPGLGDFFLRGRKAPGK